VSGFFGNWCLCSGGRRLQIRNATSQHSLVDQNPYRRPELTEAGLFLSWRWHGRFFEVCLGHTHMG
jgi:hypothetical protein